MQHNDLQKGDKVLLSGPRLGTIMDNRKGICRMVMVEARDHWIGEGGDMYVWDILALIPAETDLATVCRLTDTVELELSPAHAKKQRAIEGALIKLRHQS